MHYTLIPDKEYRDARIIEGWKEWKERQIFPDYRRYLDLFRVSPDDFAGLHILDVGCGPIGGVLPLLEKAELRVGVDVLRDRYEKEDLLDIPNGVEVLNKDVVDLSGWQWGAFHSIFCVNMLDHGETTDVPKKGFQGMFHVLKPGGTLYFHVHCRTQEQVNVKHLYALSVEEWKDLATDAGFYLDEWKIEENDPLHKDRSKNVFKTIVARLTKNANLGN